MEDVHEMGRLRKSPPLTHSEDAVGFVCAGARADCVGVDVLGGEVIKGDDGAENGYHTSCQNCHHLCSIRDRFLMVSALTSWKIE